MNKIETYKELGKQITDLKNSLDSKRTEQKALFNSITLEEAKTFTYEELGIFYFDFYYGDDERLKDLRKLYKEKKLEKYPILKTAYHYPELNEYTAIEEVGIKAIDEILYYSSFNDYLIYESSTRWCERVFNSKAEALDLNVNFKLSKQQWFDLFNFLKEKGIVEYTYVLYDEESELKSDTLKENELELLRKNIGNLDLDIDNYYEVWLHGENWDNDDCTEKEIYTKEQLDKLEVLINVKMCKRL